MIRFSLPSAIWPSAIWPSPIWVMALLALAGCGGSHASTTTPGTTGLQVVSISVPDGAVWRVNRPIDITFDRAIRWDSISSFSVRLQDDFGNAALGSYSQPVDSVGTVQTQIVRFRPLCPTLLDGSDAGFLPGGTRYVLTLVGEDMSPYAIRDANGQLLQDSVRLAFTTPVSNLPSDLFFDPVAGPPRLRLRGAYGVGLSDFETTHLELGVPLIGRAFFLYSYLSGVGLIDPQFVYLMPQGLPLNHRIVGANQVAFQAYFDQPINPEPDNLERVRLEYWDGAWMPIVTRNELGSNCSDAGVAVRLTPIGMLPRNTNLRIALKQGFEDLVGEGTGLDSLDLALVHTTVLETGVGARSDAYSEGFGYGGNHPLSMEDTTSFLPEPRAVWANGWLSPVLGTTGRSMARSKWVPFGLGGFQPGQSPLSPSFQFAGTDDQGVVEATGGYVDLAPPLTAPITVNSIESNAITLRLVDLVGLDPAYLDQPALLKGYRVVLYPNSERVGSGRGLRIADVQPGTGTLRLQLADPCLGLPGDCVALDLTQTYPSASGVTAELIPQSFGLWSFLGWGSLPDDCRITILFDATRADAQGNPDPNAALSANGGWKPEISDLDRGHWDFVRFEVHFDLDVSGDGWQSNDAFPRMFFLTIPYAWRS